jgi:hypothetical protein
MSTQEQAGPHPRGIILLPDGGKVLHVLGNPWTVKASAEEHTHEL